MPGAPEQASQLAVLGPAGQRVISVGDFGLKLARLRDQLLGPIFSEGSTRTSFALDIHFFHVLRQPRRIAMRELANRGDAGGTHQSDLGLAHAGNPHVVGDVGPFQQLLLADAVLAASVLRPLTVRAASSSPSVVANTCAFQFGGGKRWQAVDLGDGYVMILNMKKVLQAKLAAARCRCDDHVI